MDELVLSGKKYISSKRASELTGYAKDYVGQLVRSGKIEATRVGRSWFVLERSILAHAGKQAEVTPDAYVANVLRAPTMHSKALTKFYEGAGLPKTWSEINYLSDSSPLIPVSKVHPKSETDVAPSANNVAKNITMSDDSSRDMGATDKAEIHVALNIHKSKMGTAREERHAEKPSTKIVISKFDGMLPPKRELPALHKPEVKRRRNSRPLVVPYAVGALAGLVLICVIGIGAVSPNSSEYPLASAYSGIDPVISTAQEQVNQGRSAVQSYFIQLYTFSGTYIESALLFIRELLSR